MKQLIVIAHNVRSAHNVGSLLRTAEGLGAYEVLLTGYTPYPPLPLHDPRLPHEQVKIAKLIQKTALQAQDTQPWRQTDDIFMAIDEVRRDGYIIAALEQTNDAIKLPEFKAPQKIALILGREVEGIEPEVLAACDLALEIPMFGQKESFNVVQAAAMAMYHCRFVV